MPELLSLANFIDKKPKIRYFEGVEGIKEVFKDSLNYPKQEILTWFSQRFIKFENNFFQNYYIPQRLKKKIWIRAISPDDKISRDFAEKNKNTLRNTKFIPKDKFNIEIEIGLYGGNKTAIMSYDEQIGLIIESKKIYDSLRVIFEFMWDL